MAVKTIKEKKSATKKANLDEAEKVSKASPKKKAVDNDDDDDLEDDIDETDDDWGKAEEDDSWDPDFEEFDMPKKGAKKPGKGKKGADEEDDFGLDDDLNLDDDDLFGEKDEFDDDF